MYATAKEYDYISYKNLGPVVEQLYKKYGEKAISDDHVGLSNVQINSSTATLSYEWGRVETLSGSFNQTNNDTLMASTITRIDDVLYGNKVFVWEGIMTVAQYLSGDWPDATQYGDSQDNLFEVNGSTAYAGDGNDIIILEGGSASGGAGRDLFVVPNEGNTHSTIMDYQAGDKIVFPSFNSIEHLASNIIGVRDEGNSFTVDFQNRDDGFWSLTFANLRPGQLQGEDVVVGTAAWTELQPLIGAFGSATEAYFS